MYFAVSKIYIGSDQATKHDLKELTHLCQKLQSKFKISAKPLDHSDHSLSLAVTLLAGSHNAALQKLDEIIKVTEGSGIGRVENEVSLIDHIDAFDEDVDDEDAPERTSSQSFVLEGSPEAQELEASEHDFEASVPDYKLRH